MGSRFPEHDHPEGEEILVLEGVFSDQRGGHGPGSHLASPEGHRHAPWSDPGCVIFVKLRQYGGAGRGYVEVHADALDEHGRYGRYTWLRLPPGGAHAPHSASGAVVYVKAGGVASLRSG